MSESSSESRKIEVCLSPHSYPIYKNEQSIVVIIDIFRATSAICTAFEYGVEKIIPVASIDEAIEYKAKGFLVGAERNAEKLEGFDFGNSPYSYMDNSLKGKTIVLTTTNGTQAIETAKNAYKVVIGSFLNLTALCNWLIKENKSVLLLCSGWKNRFSIEDAMFAGAVADKLSKNEQFHSMGDSALATKYLYQSAKNNPHQFLHNSSHKERLAKLNLKEDIKYCLTLDKTKIIPVLKDGALIRLSLV